MSSFDTIFTDVVNFLGYFGDSRGNFNDKQNFFNFFIYLII